MISERRSSYPDLSNSTKASLDALESQPGDLTPGSPEVYALLSGLQRQVRLQRSKLDIARSKIGGVELKLREVSAAMITSQEMERRRIALDLHDSIGQSLNAISFGIGNALGMSRQGDCSAAADMLVGLSQQVKNTLIEVRRIAKNLRPAMLDDIGIVGTLSWFFREFRLVYRDLTLRDEINVDESQVPVMLRTPIFRVVQEAMSNIVKHSGATEILVTMSYEAQSVQLEITDNGCGFVNDREQLNIAVADAGIGLTGMRDRVEFSGGEFSLHSVPGKGTQINCCWGEFVKIGMQGEMA